MPRMCILSVSEQEVFDKPPVFDHREERPGIRGIHGMRSGGTVLMDQGFHAVPHRRIRQRSSVRGAIPSASASRASARLALLKTLCHQPFRPRHRHRDGRGPAPASTRTRRCRRHRRRADPPARRPCRSCRGSAGGVCGDRGDMGANLRGDFMAPNPS